MCTQYAICVFRYHSFCETFTQSMQYTFWYCRLCPLYGVRMRQNVNVTLRVMTLDNHRFRVRRFAITSHGLWILDSHRSAMGALDIVSLSYHTCICLVYNMMTFLSRKGKKDIDIYNITKQNIASKRDRGILSVLILLGNTAMRKV